MKSAAGTRACRSWEYPRTLRTGLGPTHEKTARRSSAGRSCEEHEYVLQSYGRRGLEKDREERARETKE